MSRIGLGLGLVIMWSATAYAQTLVCGRAPTPPTVDALPTDPCWQEAMVATDFSVLGSGGTQRAFRQATARACWDDAALYLHIICFEPDPTSITAQIAQRDGEVWMEDAVEIFLQPDTTSEQFFHFIVNARGTLYDAYDGSAEYDSQATVAASIGASAWQVELAIPWRQLGALPAPGSQWGFNIGREHRPADPQEWATWAPLQRGSKNFAWPKLFGRLLFAQRPQPGRAAALSLPEGLAINPDFSNLADGLPVGWRLSPHTTVHEIAPMLRHYVVRNDGDYGIISQPLDVPVRAGDFYTVYAVVRGSPDATAGIAVVQEMEDGRPDDLYPFWHMPVTGDLRLYAGHIRVDQGARRFRSLNLYRSNRTGWVEYAYVQVHPGALGKPALYEAARCTRPDERGISAPWRTPALPMFKPLPTRPLRALVLIGEFQRDAVELAQRLDLDYDLVYCPTFRGSGQVEQAIAFDAEGVLGRLARAEYDLIVLAGKPSERDLVDAILDSVRAGTGLVAIEPLAGGPPTNAGEYARLIEALPTSEGISAGALGGLDTAVCAARDLGLIRSLALGELGQGRIARLTWAEATPGLIPFASGQGQWWEYRWSALARSALWATRRLPATWVQSMTCAEELTVTVQCGPLSPSLRLEWDTPLGVLPGPEVVLQPRDGVATASLPVPEGVRRTHGPVVARGLLRAGEKALDMAACLVPCAPRVELGELTGPGEARAGETVTFAVALSGQAEAQPAVRAELVDAFGRVVSRTQAQGAGVKQLALTVREPLSVYHRVVVTALDQGTPVQRREAALLVPAASANHLDDFSLGAGYAAMPVRCPPHLQDHIVAFLRAQGVRAGTVNQYMIQRGMSAFGGQIAGMNMRYSGTSNVRDPSFADPDQVAELARTTVERVAAVRQWGFFGFNMSDEVHLHQSASVEVDASEFARAGFARWALQHYGSIAAANEEWGTNFTSADAITVPLLADLRGSDNPARWVDFRLFMDEVWAGAYQATQRAVRERFPEVRMSFTNPYRFDSLSGVDFARWVPAEQLLLRYCHRHVMDRNRSWTDAPIVSWFGYRRSAQEAGHFLWWFALNGGVVALWWDPLEPWAYSGAEGFTAWQMCDPLWRPTPRSQAVTAAAADLQAGIGKLLRVAAPAAPEALVVHSQASLHTLYALAAFPAGKPTPAAWDAYLAADDALAAALKRRGLSYRYILPTDLTDSDLSRVRLIVLPGCVALSDAQAAGLQRYVAAGGALLADLMPGSHDEHGRPRTTSPLSALFAGEHAVCLGRQADAAAAGELDAALERLGVSAALPWRCADGALPAATELYRYQLGVADYLGLVRAPTAEAEAEGPVTIELPEPRWVYDCRRGEALGRLQRLTLPVAAGDASFLALLPYQPDAVTVAASAEGDTLKVTAAIEAAVTPTDHVLHIAVTPAGASEPALCYMRNVVAPHGQAQLNLPLGLDDPPGEWRITVRDVATGLRAEMRLSVSRR